MSLSRTIFDTIEDTIKIYIKNIASKHNLNENELYKLWNENADYNKVQTQSKVESKVESILDPELMKLTKKELSEICKTKKLPVSGTKTDLIKRILETSSETKINKTSSNNSNSNSKPTQPDIIKKLVDKIPVIQIKRNSHGNYEHSETKFVINNTTKKVYGKQNEDGNISELTKEDIDLCHKYKFSYDIPENLDKKDLEDDEDEIDDLEEIVDEEVVEEETEDLEEDEDDLDDEELIDEDELEEEYYEDE
jgi:hypothetical protein